ncbi:MAG: hypothetical protein Q8M99_10685 [Methylotenera sp.]|nr:hypothetical protein [Methylotenera sp.]
MKSKYLVTLLSVATLLAAGSVHAEVDYKNINQQNLSKRPYQQVVENNTQKKDQQWEGATLIADQVSDDAVLNDRKTFRLNMLSKRPY